MTTLLRWSIDEITDDTVTVLQSTYLQPFEGFRPEDRTEQLQALEAEVLTDAWSDEEDATLDLQAVQAFLNAGMGARARPLREGDVYWLQAPEKLDLSQYSSFSGSGFADSALEQVVSVEDGTAAARLAVKNTYAQAIEPASGETLNA